MGKTTSLSNKTILITRPSGREAHLRFLIEQAGGNIIHYPVINIQPPLEIKQLQKLNKQLSGFTMAIFISPTAVEQSQRYFPSLPEQIIIVSIGSKTSAALEKQNIHVDIEAPEHNTESLLNTGEFQKQKIQGKHILIVRGNGGRALLGNTLLDRGALIHYAETYRREIPEQPPLTKKQIKSLAAITVSSNQGLDNLVTMMQGPALLIDTPLIVPSQRAATLAKQYGFNTIINANNATDEATVAALTAVMAKPV